MKKGFLFATAALLLFGVGRASAGGPLADVSPDAWYYSAVKTVTALGIMKGDAQGNFRPDDKVTRSELAEVIDSTVKAVKSHDTSDDSAVNVVATAVPSTVRIDVSGDRYGAGFFVGENLILTNWHVAEFGNISVKSSSAQSFHGEVVKKDESRDLALIKIEAQEHKFKPLEFASEVRWGEGVLAIGTPQGYSFKVSKGIVSNPVRYVDKKAFIETDAAINPGNSGGPLLNMDGKVIGVVGNKNSADGFEGIGFAIPYSDAKRFVTGN